MDESGGGRARVWVGKHSMMGECWGKTEILGASSYVKDTNESLHLTQAGDVYIDLDCDGAGGGQQDARA